MITSSRTPFLISLEEKVDKLIMQTGPTADADFYMAIKKIINLQLNEDDVNNRYDEFSDMIIAFAKMDFTKRMLVKEEKDFFGHIALSMNMLGEELQYMAAPRNYLDDLLDEITEPAFITDDKDIIRFTNKHIDKLLGFEENELLGKSLDIFFTINPNNCKPMKGEDYFKSFYERNQEGKVLCTMIDKASNPIDVEIKVKLTGNRHLNPNGTIFIVTRKEYK